MCKAIIIGGGIGGLTAAIALEQAGLEAHVYERVAELREVGAGISLWANAVRALKVLGLADSLSAHGWSPLRGTLRTSTGEILTSSQSHHTADAGVTVGALHRADLLRLLREAVDDARVHVGRECVRVSSDHGAVTAHFADGSAAAGDVLIGADGLHSVVRAAVHTTAPPRYAGYTAWRGVVEFTAPAAASESWGRGQRFGIVPLNDGRVYWFATKNAPEHDRDPVGTVKTRLIDRFHGWHTPIEALLDATPESAILRNDIYDRDPDGPWTADRVTLLGDAAHPMTPNLGQGACQAIEDAVVLAACLAQSVDVETALHWYQVRRLPRTRRIVLLSRRIGQLAQWEQPLACWLRTQAMRAAPSWMNERQIRSILDEQILTDEELAVWPGVPRNPQATRG